MTVILTMTTIPSRMDTALRKCLVTLSQQSFEDYEIHLNIPEIYPRTGEAYPNPDWLKDVPRLKVFRGVEDMGPKTKIIPTLKRVRSEALIITADDDIIYSRDMINYHIKMHDNHPVTAIGFSGTKDKKLVLTPREDIEVDVLDNYKTASYYSWWFGEDFFKYYADQSWNDDIVVSAYLRDTGVKKIVAAYEGETWFRPRVNSFPIINTIPCVVDGCDLIRGHANKNTSEEIQAMYEAVGR